MIQLDPEDSKKERAEVTWTPPEFMRLLQHIEVTL
jgi:hypothetical protein